MDSKQNAKGYGYFGYAGKGRKAHRVSWELVHGPIDSSVELDHICGNRGCVRPSHLRPATRKQNMENQHGAHANSKSGVRGVFWRANLKRWQAQVNHAGRRHHVGYFTQISDAEAAVIAKRNELFTHNELDRK